MWSLNNETLYKNSTNLRAHFVLILESLGLGKDIKEKRTEVLGM
jgi:hypothetical protein